MLPAILAALPLLLTQDPFPKAGSDPTGIVVDTNGRKVDGARVSLRCDVAASWPWSRSIQQVLRETPLPSAVSSRDGDFVLPLARDQRLLGIRGEGSFWLVVEKPGFQRWVEPLVQGLTGCLGSRVVLEPLGDADRVVVQLEDPEPGLRVRIERLGSTELDAETLPVPADGRVEARMPLLPSPNVAPEPFRVHPVGLRARAWRGNEPLGTKALGPGIETHWPKSEWDVAGNHPQGGPASRPASNSWGSTRSVLVRVKDPAGRPVAGAIVLVHDAAAGLLTRPVAATSGASRTFDTPVPHTDARGEARITGLPYGNDIPLRVCATDMLFDECKLEAAARGEHVVEVTAVPSQELRLWTTDVEQTALPFETVHPLWKSAYGRSSDPQARFTLIGDSLGRIAVRLPAFESMSLVHGSHARRITIAASVEPLRWELERRTCALVRLPPGLPIRGYEYRHMAGTSSNGEGWDPAACGALLRFAEEDAHACLSLAPAFGPPLRVTTEELRAAARTRGIAVVDRSRVVRRIPVVALGPDGVPVERLGVAHAGSFPSGGELVTGNGVWPILPLERAADGTWVLPACEFEGFTVVLMSPTAVPRKLTIPARAPAARDEPIEVRFEQGAMLAVKLVPREFSLPAARPGARLAELTLTSVAHGVEALLLDSPRFDRLQLEQPLVIPCPRGFRAGKYSLRVGIGKQVVAREIELVLGKLVTVDLTPASIGGEARSGTRR